MMNVRTRLALCTLALTTSLFFVPPAAADPNGCTGFNPPSPTVCVFHCHFNRPVTVTYTILAGPGPATVTATCDGVVVARCTATAANPTCTATGIWFGRDGAFGLCTGTAAPATVGVYSCFTS